MTGRVIHVPTAACGFADDRRWVSLQDACLGVFDCPHSTPAIVAEGPYVVRSQDIRTGRLDLATTARVSEATYQERIERAEPRAGDLLYSREGTYFGIAAEVPPDVRVCLGQRMVLIRPNPEVIVSRYLLYWLNSPIMAAQVAAFRDGSVAERLNMPTIRGLPVPLTDMETQRRIADVLGGLDDKIALNARMNATLEAMARAVFEDWFVRFGPVRAKAERRAAPGLAPDLAALFPDRLTETPDGEVPEGWRFGTLGDVAVNRTDICQPEALPRETPYIGLEHIPRRSIALDSWGNAGDAGSAKLRFQRGDFLFGKLRPYFHKVGIAAVDGVCTTDAVVLRAKKLALGPFVLMHISSTDFVAYTDRSSTGTKMPRTRWQDMARYRCVISPPSLAQAFADVASPMMDRIVSNIHETRTLTALRDLLLPRLVSGQLRLRDAEREVGAAL